MPTPKPTPVPVPTPSSRVVCSKTVSSGQSILSAANGAANGQTVCVRSGTYRECGDLTKAVKLVSHPGNTVLPVIDQNATSSDNCRLRLKPSSAGAVIDGFEIRDGWEGLKIEADNITVRNSIIRDNRQGIYAGSVSNLLVENSKLDNNGNTPLCAAAGHNPQQCHNFYFAITSSCRPVNNYVIRNNEIRNAPGYGIHMRSTCSARDTFSGVVVEGNNFASNCSHIMLNASAPGMRIVGNTFDSRQPCPPSNMSPANKVNINLNYNQGPAPTVKDNRAFGPYPMYRK